MMKAIWGPLVLQVACSLPDSVPRRQHALIVIAIYQSVVGQSLPGEGFSDEMLLNLDFVHI